ncbi:MAG: hypothetical protein JNN07_19090 [Verrucomicrobiales bacterium]|nr:hypothetical protein [Verrucomicrobiales bacterium]
MTQPISTKSSGVQLAARRIQELIGLDLGTLTTRSMQRALQTRREALGLSDPADYLSLLDSDPEELQNLIDEVVVPETWFHREPEAIDMMVSLARQARRSAKRRFPLRILSVPCSGGEEPYSLVMALLDAGLSPGEFVVLAADVSRRSLRRAEKGLYAEASFRGGNLGFRSRYFEACGEGYQLQEGVRSQVTFHHDNLLSSLFLAGTEPVDFLFCRNLFIYFRPETRRRPMEHLVRLMRPDGFLFCGASEYRCFGRGPFRLEKLGSTYACRVDRMSAPAGGPASRGRALSLLSHPEPTTGTPAPVVDTHTQARTPNRDLIRARRLANEGLAAESAAICESILKEGMDCVEALSLLALIREAEGRMEEAVQLYRKAVYLDPHHYESLVHLALLRERLGDQEEASTLRARARRVQVDFKRLP